MPGMFHFNTVVVSGRLGRDPELRATRSGKSVCTARLAIPEQRKVGDRDYEDAAVWINVILWDKMAERFVGDCQKGTEVVFEGSLRANEWEKDGQKRTDIEINAARYKLLTRGEGRGGDPAERRQPAAAGAGSQASAPWGGGGEEDDDIPF